MISTDTSGILAQLLKYRQGHAYFLWEARILRGKLYLHKQSYEEPFKMIKNTVIIKELKMENEICYW